MYFFFRFFQEGFPLSRIVFPGRFAKGVLMLYSNYLKFSGRRFPMSKASEFRTNVMRILEQAKVPFRHHCYVESGAVSGLEVATALGQDPAHVFKTLVTVGKSGEHFVFVVPVNAELNLKKAAKAVSDKSVEMIKLKELFPLTGYIHGGCSPIGMKKQFRTVIHESAASLDAIFFSAGKIGYQIEILPADLAKVLRFTYADIAD
jgi:Cys-tRNA(Pro)/Cys-tRNA(Cys) deacylase